MMFDEKTLRQMIAREGGGMSLATAVDEVIKLSAEVRRLHAENDSLMALARFGRWSLGFHLEGYHEKYSSYDRDAAFDLGILEEVRVEKPCSDNCQCKFYDNVFPRNCVRETPLAQLPEKRE